MYVVVSSLRYRLIAAVVSLVVFGVIYFTVIRPDNNAANHAVVQGEKQLQQAVKNANGQSGGAVPAGVVNLTSCLTAAGTDTSKIQACDAKFKP
jgi:branched-subunit amino acid permease